MSSTRLPRLAVAAATLLLSTGLVACGTGEEPAPGGETPSATETTTSPTTPATNTTATTDTSAPTSTTSATDTAAEETTTSADKNGGGMSPEVEPVYEEFSSLAPRAVFEQFETCNPTGIEKSFECSGPEIGQFQFFSSSAKAASTTQLLTELRSSRVVEDTGRRVVGWSTLGTTAVITVVDNEEGLVMQQMVSSDQVDPEEQIHDLGLVTQPTEDADASETTTETAE
ncbi:hypothetical protein [Corynebacterium halotolerans]|uniref:Beta-N-acetylglucosaminidase n=1 Tax=Corynebacterium halotolerans YIM 70093 = DSM 44683 TaxID=1121362 RepID=M1P545_9CORY|nr:hypothetical protein [Corynebacterium halotolerans]AGF71791.1 hypothetical protein A605_03900 [Corynebacterium halotolerans YIM 70093 = DSM 44683]